MNGEEIETTPWHLFYTDEGWVEAGDLEAGDLLLSLGGVYGEVENILIEEHTETMYDLTIEEVHTFAVGDGDWVVHNEEWDKCVIGFGIGGTDTNNNYMADDFAQAGGLSQVVQLMTHNPRSLILTVDKFGGGFRGLLEAGISESSILGRSLSSINPNAVNTPFNVNNLLEVRATYDEFAKVFGQNADEIVIFSPNPLFRSPQYNYAIEPALRVLRPRGRLVAFISEGVNDNLSNYLQNSLTQLTISSQSMVSISSGQNPLGFTNFLLGQTYPRRRVGIYDGIK